MKKAILIGSILAAFLMLMTPCISAINVQTTKAAMQERITTAREEIGTKFFALLSKIKNDVSTMSSFSLLSLRTLINRILGLWYMIISIPCIPVCLILVLLTLVVGPFAGWLTGWSLKEIIQNTLELAVGFLRTPFQIFQIGLILFTTGEWPDFNEWPAVAEKTLLQATTI